MAIIADHAGKLFEAVPAGPAGEILSQLPRVPFPCLIWDHDGLLSGELRAGVIARLLDADCRYAVCGGMNCERWHDDFDGEFIHRNIDDIEAACETAQVMTTCHRGESPDDVAFFFVFNTNFDDHIFTHFVVLHIGAGLAVDELEASVRKHAVHK